jgi:hypothetical protein
MWSTFLEMALDIGYEEVILARAVKDFGRRWVSLKSRLKTEFMSSKASPIIGPQVE